MSLLLPLLLCPNMGNLSVDEFNAVNESIDSVFDNSGVVYLAIEDLQNV